MRFEKRFCLLFPLFLLFVYGCAGSGIIGRGVPIFPVPGFHEYDITSEPSGVEIFFNGKFIGKTPLTWERMLLIQSIERIRIEARHPDYETGSVVYMHWSILWDNHLLKSRYAKFSPGFTNQKIVFDLPRLQKESVIEIPELILDEALIAQAYEWAAEMGYNPIPVYTSEDGELFVLEGTLYNTEDRGLLIRENDIVINVGEVPCQIADEVLHKGYYLILKDGGVHIGAIEGYPPVESSSAASGEKEMSEYEAK